MTRRPTLLMLTLLAGGMLLAGPQAWAQQGKSSRYDWPRTFTGQPDFEFDKAEVVDERAKQAEPQGLPAPKPPTLRDLMDDEDITLQTVVPEVVSSTEVTSDTAVDGEALAKLKDMTLSLASLPSLTTARALDLTDFRKGLRHAVRRAVADYHFQAGRYSLAHMLRAVTLQAVVTSPERYAVINDKQYREGESFPITVWAGPSDAELLDAMAAQLPMEGSMSDEQAAQYQQAYEDAVKELAATRQNNPHSLEKQVVAPATLVAIQHRKVVLEFNGQRHELEIRYAY